MDPSTLLGVIGRALSLIAGSGLSAADFQDPLLPAKIASCIAGVFETAEAIASPQYRAFATTIPNTNTTLSANRAVTISDAAGTYTVTIGFSAA